MLGADHTKAISRHERTQVIVQFNAELNEAHLHDGPALGFDTARRLSCDAPVCAVLMGKGKEILDLGRTQRLPNRAQRRALMCRDGGCRFPGCTERRYVEAHHIVHWADGGPTDLSNLVLLCWAHHHAMHEGGYRMALTSGAVTVWRPDGSLLRSEALVVPDGPDIVEQNKVLGLSITPESVASRWTAARSAMPTCPTPSSDSCSWRTATNERSKPSWRPEKARSVILSAHLSG